MSHCAAAADQSSFRSLMATFATGVTVVTSTGADGPAGMTANAVASLSLDPMLVMIGFDLRSRTLTAARMSRLFAVNVLASDQEQVSRTFAGKQSEREKFTACAHTEHAGVPILDGTLAWLRCTMTAVYPGGDHMIVVGKVVDMGGNGGEPLLFYGGRYRMLDRACRAGQAAQ
ncbi:MAG TPA: flavin reductase family protein [Streptosporangiaceae bacterium]|nr:flavin reductase family protein [Streptosporangiaceae bacterium]